jgi:N-methylhydantoinase B
VTLVSFDPVRVEVWRHLLASIAEEMGATLERTGYSPNIKERRDYSCALFDANGHLMAQAAHIPVHLGAMPLMMERLRHIVSWPPGTMWLCNDPAHGGTHLPDLTLVAPIYMPETSSTPSSARKGIPGVLIGFVANRAHHADIGGLVPGSLPLSTELYHEGLIIPPVRLVVGDRLQSDVMNFICTNSRTPSERRGDLAAQIAANRTGIRRFIELVAHYGREEVNLRSQETQQYAEAMVRARLRRAPEGEYHFMDYLDDDGIGQDDLTIHVRVRLKKERISFDFTGTAPEVPGSVNATEAVTRSACYYVVRCLVEEEVPMNAGAFAAVEVNAPEGTLVNAHPACAISAGNVETSQRIVDVLLGALAPAFPDCIPAASQGTMNNLMIGGYDPFRGSRYAYYETICGGAGGSPHAPGASAIHVHMTNTRNTPIEVLEAHYPLRVQECALRPGSGGAGRHPGGDGVVRSIELLAPAHVTLITERRRHAPYGLAGGEPGATGLNTLRLPDGTEQFLPSKFSGACETGSLITVATPGGGGWGYALTPWERK